jgi:hypothetical protein
MIMIVSVGSLYSQEKPMKILFLGMKDGCPNTPAMRASLDEAIAELGLEADLDSLDLNALSDMKDPRAGYGSPTILVDGKDIFGAEPRSELDPACRFYMGGVPGTEEIAQKLLALKK